MVKPRVTASLSEEVSVFLDGAVEAGLYTNTGDGIRSSLREYFASHPDVALESAIALYDEEVVDLIDAARLAKKSPAAMKDELAERSLLMSNDA